MVNDALEAADSDARVDHRRNHEELNQSGGKRVRGVFHIQTVNNRHSKLILNSAVGARQSSGKLLMLNQCLCLENSTMATPFGEAR